MKTYLYRIGEITLLLCPVTCMPSSGVLLNIKETSGADFVCLLMPDATHDAAIALYGADALFHPTYEALVASAYHLSITRGLPIYEFSFILDGTAHQVIVEKSTEDVLLNAKKYKQITNCCFDGELAFQAMQDFIKNSVNAGIKTYATVVDGFPSANIDVAKCAEMVAKLGAEFRVREYLNEGYSKAR